MPIWIEEYGRPYRLQLRAEKIHFEGQSDYQHIVVLENFLFGRVLVIDDVVQTTERDEFFYHEMCVHVPLLAHGDVRTALIIGGGDGGALEEILKHPTVEAVTLVDLDEAVVEVAKEHLRPICGEAFEDPRAEVVIADGVDYLSHCGQRYDFVLIDSTDPIGLHKDSPDGARTELFSSEFYVSCKRSMTPGGVLVTQNAVPFVESSALTMPLANLRPNFADSAFYRVSVPSFFGGEMVFSMASDDKSLRTVDLATLEERFERVGIETRYYDPTIHLSAFHVPRFLAQMFD